jgi:hypothetical protein
MAVTKLEKDDPTDLEELMRWTTRIVLGGLAAGIVIGAIGFAFWVLIGIPAEPWSGSWRS